MKKLDISDRGDLTEAQLNDLLQVIWENGEETPKTIIISKSQIGTTIPKVQYTVEVRDPRPVEVALDMGVTAELARKLMSKYHLKAYEWRSREDIMPSHYISDFGVSELEVVE